MPPPTPIDEFLRGVLKENHKYLQLQEDKLLQKMQQKVLNVLRPQDSTQCKTDRVEIDLSEVTALLRGPSSIIIWKRLWRVRIPSILQ